jgi:hypothetical protein
MYNTHPSSRIAGAKYLSRENRGKGDEDEISKIRNCPIKTCR